MNGLLSLIISILIILPTTATNRKQLLDSGWQFIYGEQQGMPSAAAWQGARTLNLPHDWSVETDAATEHGSHVGPFITDGDYQKGFMMGGEAWYRRTFRLDGKKVGSEFSIYFEGAYNHATIYFNGTQVYFNHYGYQSFRAVLPHDLLRFNGENELVVKCENKGLNTRWYSGSGIFRHVWLECRPFLHINDWDTSITTDPATGRVTVHTSVTSMLKSPSDVNVYLDILDANHNKIVGTEAVLPGVVGSATAAIMSTTVKEPKLWTADTPYLYIARVRIEGIDEYEVPFGIRSVSFSTTNGLCVNGKSVLLRGGCVHHDHGLLGAASWDDAEVRKIKLLKQNGFNAVRCSHNLPSEAMLRACDSLGMYVIDECFDQWFVQKNADDYHNYFPQHYLSDLETMLRRDRNHPSVIMWSIGNEIPGRSKENAMWAARNMRDLINRLGGDERPVTAALCTWDDVNIDWRGDYALKTTASLDIVCYNYMWRDYDRDVQTHQWLICGTETYPKEASQNWDRVERETKIVGDFVWTAMDYLGEAGIGHGLFVKEGERSPFFMPYPYYNGWCGDIDLIGQKKPQSYYRDVVWRRSPITMAVELPCPAGYHREISSWGWQPEVNAWEDPKVFFTQHNLPNILFDGAMKPLSIKPADVSNKQLNVNVYSRSKQVRLYLNGRLIDTKSTGDTYHAGFVVDYEPGTLRAVEFDGVNEGASFELHTAGKPVGIRTKVEKYSRLHYVTAELVDREGRVVHEYERKVTFQVKGDARIIAAGNANPTDMESFRSSAPRLYDGRAMAILEVWGEYTLRIN
ncbi:MAG: DUF4982 domain-containing protein [Bacteroidaceae bacterium]|nr:DUF4982 domain-containing protein [Bacteroidaceae bacterium]